MNETYRANSKKYKYLKQKKNNNNIRTMRNMPHLQFQ